MRYICEPLDSLGRTRCGTMGVMVRHYASDANAMRYFQKHLDNTWHQSPGKYLVSRFPESQFQTTEVGELTKK